MILLLTGCINPDGMAYTALSNAEERKKQYVNAIQFYLSHTNYPIVFTENSGNDITALFLDAISSGRLECLTFTGNQDKERGKGYGECEIIQYTLENSQLIRKHKNQRIAKITGRLIIRNIKTIVRIHVSIFTKRTTFCAINTDLTFPDSRFIIASKEFYHTFLQKKESINDTKGYYFELALGDTIKKERQFRFFPFLIMPRIEGQSGTTGVAFINQKMSWSFAMKYAKYALSQYHRFYMLYR